LYLEEINQLYRTTICTKYYINPTIDGLLISISITSCDYYSDTGLENWKQCLHDVSTRRYKRIDHVVRWVGTEIREPPIFHCINRLKEFLTKYEEEVSNNQRLLALDMSLKDTPTRWWVRTKKQLRTGTNARDYCTLDSVQIRQAMRCRDMMEKGHQKNT
jgi:hypothetical protein